MADCWSVPSFSGAVSAAGITQTEKRLMRYNVINLNQSWKILEEPIAKGKESREQSVTTATAGYNCYSRSQELQSAPIVTVGHTDTVGQKSYSRSQELGGSQQLRSVTAVTVGHSSYSRSQ